MNGLLLDRPIKTQMGPAAGGFFGNNIADFVAITFLGLRDIRSLSRAKIALKFVVPIIVLILQSKVAEALSDGKPSETAKSYIRGAKVGTIVSIVGQAIEMSILANRNELAIQSPAVKGVLINPPTKPLPVNAVSSIGVARPRI